MSDDILTVEALADAKGIPTAVLMALGVKQGDAGVLISYGEKNRTRSRTSADPGDGFKWIMSKRPIVPYGVHLDQSALAVKHGQLFIVEGESDCWTAWYHSRAALGVPGAKLTKVLEHKHVAEIEKTYVLREPGSAGADFVAGVRDRFAAFEVEGLDVPELFELVLPGVKDLSDLHLTCDGNTERFEIVLDRAIADAPRIWPPDQTLIALVASIAEVKGRWPVLSDDALYGLAGDVVNTWEPHTEADRASLLFELLAGFGNLVGNGPVAMGGQEHRAKVFPIIVGKTSRGRKGTGNYNIKMLFKEVDADWARNGVTGGTASGEGIIRAAADRDGKPLLIVETEFSRLLKAAARDGSIVSEVVRQTWDDTVLHNATAKNPVHIHDTHVTVVGHATAEELIARLDHIDIFNGFANRFVLVAVKRSKRLPSGGDLPDDDLGRLVTKLRAALDKAREVTLMERSAEAEQIWADFYNSVPDDEPGLVGATIARAEAQVLRLQMVYALLDGSAVIEAEHVWAAMAAWDYNVDTARWLHGDRLGDPDAEKLIENLADAPTGLNATQVSALYKRHRTAQQIDAIKERADLWLRRHGLCLREIQEQTGGRPRVITKMVPLHGEVSEESEPARDVGQESSR